MWLRGSEVLFNNIRIDRQCNHGNQVKYLLHRVVTIKPCLIPDRNVTMVTRLHACCLMPLNSCFTASKRCKLLFSAGLTTTLPGGPLACLGGTTWFDQWLVAQIKHQWLLTWSLKILRVGGGCQGRGLHSQPTETIPGDGDKERDHLSHRPTYDSTPL